MKKGLKVVATFTLLCFMTTQCVSAFPGARIEMAGPRELPFYQSMDIPEELGTVDALYEAPARGNPQFILHIQNAHANYQAQMKIKQLLGYMNKKYGFKTIFVEGASEKLDADYLRLFPDQERNLKLCDELAKQGELTGAELFLMEQSAEGERRTAYGEKTEAAQKNAALRTPYSAHRANNAVEALGIEEASLYKANYDALKKVFGAETDVTRFFKGFDGKLDQVASRTFTPETRELIADWKRFEQGRRDFMPFVKSLAAKSRKILKVDLESLFAQVGWPQITRLLVIQMMEKDLNKTKGVEEQAALLKMLRTQGVSQELLTALENFKEGSITVGKSATEVSPREVLERLASEAGPKGFEFSDYPAFSLYAGHVTLRSELDPKVLFEEIEYLFTQMLDTLAQEPEQKVLLALYRDGELLRKLLRLELNRAQWRQVLETKDRIGVPSLVSRLKDAVQGTEQGVPSAEYGEKNKAKNSAISSTPYVSRRTSNAAEALGEVMPPKFAKTMDGLFTAGLEFYDFAHKREAVFYKEMQNAMAERKINKAILITGGFHTDGMSDLFRENAVSYGIVTPRLSEKSNENLYRTNMLQSQNYLFSISNLEMAAKLMPLMAQYAQGVSIHAVYEVILNAMMKVGEENIDEVVRLFNQSNLAKENKITLVRAGDDAQGKPTFRIVARTAEAPVTSALRMGDLSILSGPIPSLAPAGRSEMRQGDRQPLAKEIKTILVVDDETSLAEVVQIMLKKTNFDVEVAHSGKDALEKLNEFTPDAILTDVRMPGMTGYDWVREAVKKQGLEQVPVVFMSGDVGDQTAFDNAFNELAGNHPVHLIDKPFQMAALIALFQNPAANFQRWPSRSEVRRGPKSFVLTVSRWALVTGIAFFAYVWISAFFMAGENAANLRKLSQPQAISVSALVQTPNIPGSWETLGSPFLRYSKDLSTGLLVFEKPYHVAPVEMTRTSPKKMTLAQTFFNNDRVAVARVKTLDKFVRESWPELSKNLDPYIRYGVGMAGSKNAGKSVERPEALQQALWIIQRIAPERFEILKKWKARFLQTQFAEGEAGWVEGDRFFGAGGKRAIIHYVDDGTSPSILAIVIGGHEAAHIPSLPATPWDFYVWLHTLAPEILRSIPSDEEAILTGAEPVFVDKLLRITPKVGQSFIEKKALEWGYRASTWQMAARGFLTFFFDGMVLFFLGLFHRKAKESAEERTRWGDKRFRSEVRGQLEFDFQDPTEIRRKELTEEIRRLVEEALPMAYQHENSIDGRISSGARGAKVESEKQKNDELITKLESELKAARKELAQLSPARSEVRVGEVLTPEDVTNGVVRIGGTNFALGNTGNKEMAVAEKGQADIVLTDLDVLGTVSKIEALVFQALFFDSITHPRAKEYRAKVDAIKELKAKKGAAPSEIKGKETELRAFLAEIGYHDVLLPGMILSHRLPIVVPNETQRERVIQMLINVFVGLDFQTLLSQAEALQAAMPETSRYSEKALKEMLAEFEANRSFTFPGAAFFNPGTGKARTSEEIARRLAEEILDIRVATADGIKVRGASGDMIPIRYEPEAGRYMVGESGSETVIGRDVFEQQKESFQEWPAVQKAKLQKELGPENSTLRVIDFGTGDPSPFSGNQDYTNLAFIRNGEIILVDPSIRTIRNLEEMGLWSGVNAISISHVHYDHVGGILDLLHRRKAQPGQSKLKLIAPVFVYAQLRLLTAQMLGVTEDEATKLLSDAFDWQAPSIAKDSLIARYDLDGGFSNVRIETLRTFGHPLPTFGYKVTDQTTGASVAYLTDSRMPGTTLKDGTPNLRHKEMVDFYGGADLLLGENGVPGVHITTDELVRDFPGHVKRGSLFTVHAAGLQTKAGLQRFSPFMVLPVQTHTEREEEIRKIREELDDDMARGVFPKLSDATRDALAVATRRIEFNPEEVIFTEGRPVGDNPLVFIHVGGKYDVWANGTRVASRVPPGLLGEMGIIIKRMTQEQYGALTVTLGKELERFVVKFKNEAGETYSWDVNTPDLINELPEGSNKEALLNAWKSSAPLGIRTSTVKVTEKSRMLSMEYGVFMNLLAAHPDLVEWAVQTTKIRTLAVQVEQIKEKEVLERTAEEEALRGESLGRSEVRKLSERKSGQLKPGTFSALRNLISRADLTVLRLLFRFFLAAALDGALIFLVMVQEPRPKDYVDFFISPLGILHQVLVMYLAVATALLAWELKRGPSKVYPVAGAGARESKSRSEARVDEKQAIMLRNQFPSQIGMFPVTDPNGKKLTDIKLNFFEAFEALNGFSEEQLDAVPGLRRSDIVWDPINKRLQLAEGADRLAVLAYMDSIRKPGVKEFADRHPAGIGTFFVERGEDKAEITYDEAVRDLNEGLIVWKDGSLHVAGLPIAGLSKENYTVHIAKARGTSLPELRKENMARFTKENAILGPTYLFPVVKQFNEFKTPIRIGSDKPLRISFEDANQSIQDGWIFFKKGILELVSTDAEGFKKYIEARRRIASRRSEAREVSPVEKGASNQIRELLGQGKTPGDIWDTMTRGTQDQDTVRLDLLRAMDVAMPEAQAAARNLFIGWVAQEIRVAAEGQRDAFGYGRAYGYALGLLRDRGVKLQNRFVALKYSILREQKNENPIHKDVIRTLLEDMLNSNRAQKMDPNNWVSNRSRAVGDPVWDPVSEILDDLSGRSKKSEIDWEKVWVQFNGDGSLQKAFGDEKVSQLQTAFARLYPLGIAKWARDERKVELRIDEYGKSVANRAEIISLNDPAVRILTELGYTPSAGENGHRINEIDWWLAADAHGYPRLLELARELRGSSHMSDRLYLLGRTFGLGPMRQRQISEELGLPDRFRSAVLEAPARVMAAANVAALAERLGSELDGLTDVKLKPTVRAEGDKLVIATSGMGEMVVSNLVGIRIEDDHFAIDHWDSTADQLRTDTMPLVLPFKVPNDRPQITLDEYRAMVSISEAIPEAQIRTLKETSFAALNDMEFRTEDFKGQPALAVAVAVTYGIVSNEKGNFEAIAPLLMQMASLIDAKGLAGIVKALLQAVPAGTKIPITTEPGNAVMILEDLTDSDSHAIVGAIKFNVLLHPNVTQYVFVRDIGARAAVATTLKDIKQWLKTVNHRENSVLMVAWDGKGTLQGGVSKFLKAIPRQAFVVSGTGTALINLSFGNAAQIQVEGEVWDKTVNRPVVMDITSRAAQVSAESLEKQAPDLGLFGKNGQFMINKNSILMLQNLQVLFEAFQTIQAAA